MVGLAFLGNLNYHYGVYVRNAEYYYVKDAAAAAAAWWFRTFFLFNFVVRIIAPGMYDADFADIDARGLDYSLSQATSYHYWEGKENHSIVTMLWVNYVTDALKLAFGWWKVLAMAPGFIIYDLIYIFAYPLILTIRLITPWAETEGETPLMWWVNAIELGIYDPMDPPTNFWEIEAARKQYMARFDGVERDPDSESDEEDADAGDEE